MDGYNCRMCGQHILWNERHTCTVGGYTYYRTKMIPSEELAEARALSAKLLQAGKDMEQMRDTWKLRAMQAEATVQALTVQVTKLRGQNDNG